MQNILENRYEDKLVGFAFDAAHFLLVWLPEEVASVLLLPIGFPNPVAREGRAAALDRRNVFRPHIALRRQPVGRAHPGRAAGCPS